MIARMTGGEPNLPELEPPDGCWDGTDRPGPLFPYSTWPSLAAAFLATAGISAALHAREVTGRGQWVETSLLQGVLIATWGGWQRAEHPEAPGYDTWIFDSRTTRGLFECADGQWVCQWVPNPAFALGASEGDELRVTDDTRAPRDDPTRITPESGGDRRPAPLLPAHGRRVSEVPRRGMGASRRAGRHRHAADPFSRSGARRPGVARRRVCHGRCRSRVRPHQPGRHHLPAVGSAHERPWSRATCRRARRRGARRSGGGRVTRAHGAHGSLARRAARRHPRPRPRSGRRRSVRHPAAVRPRRRRDQDQHAPRRVLALHPYRDGL